MSLIVQKFGGSSVANSERVFNVARIITNAYAEGNDVIAVVSAQGNTTDELINKAMDINKNASKREMDVLLSAGEQISMALLAMAIESLGFPVVSLLGWQAGFNTCLNHSNAKIKTLNTKRIEEELEKKNIVVIAGFQGINNFGDITTLGRGGSDTSAVAIAAVMKADSCKIYTDVGGVFFADPCIVPDSKKIDVINYDEMLTLSTLGNQVLHSRSIEIAKQYNVEVEVLSSFEKDLSGTIVKKTDYMEQELITGLAIDKNISKISVINFPSDSIHFFELFSIISDKDINTDIILQTVEKNNTKDLTFTVNKNHLEKTTNLIKTYTKDIDSAQVFVNNNVAKLSVVGTGVAMQSGILGTIFKSLYEENVNIHMITTSENKVSLIISTEDIIKASNAINKKF